MKRFIVLLLAFTVSFASFVPDSIAVARSSDLQLIDWNQYSHVLIDADNDYYFVNLVKSEYGFEQYAGKNVTIKGINECTILYNIEEKEIILASHYSGLRISSGYIEVPEKDIYFGTFKYSSPKRFEGIYTWLGIGKEPKYRVTKLELNVEKGVFPGLPSAKKYARNMDVSLQQEGNPNSLKLGALIPQSGGLESLGEAYNQTLQLAQEDAQEYLNQADSDLSVELFIEDNQTDPGESYHRIQDLRSKGVSIFLGPQDSDSVNYMKQFADADDYLLFSSSSTAIALSLPDDNVMRCISDDTHQAAALIDKAQADGITNLYIVARTNLYGYDFSQALERGFIEKGGAVKTFLYSKPDADIPYVVEELTTALSEQAALSDGKKVGVALIAFDEGIDIMELASASTDASNVQWYGTDSIAQSMALLQNTKAAEFATQTNFTCTTIGRPQNGSFKVVADKVEAKLGYAPPTLPLLIYDAYQLAVRAYQQAGTSEVETMKSALAEVAETYEGISGDMSFNANDDRATGIYDYWAVYAENGQYFWDSESNWTGEPVSILEWALLE